MFCEQTQSFSGERSTFARECKCFAGECKVFWGNNFFASEQKVFLGGEHNTSANECKWLERLQSFLRERKCFVGESKCFMQMFYKQTQSSSGKCITFSRERKCFAKECSQECFSGEHLCFASDRKVSWGNNIFARKSKSICHPISFFPITMFPSGLCKPTPSVNFLSMWIFFFPCHQLYCSEVMNNY